MFESYLDIVQRGAKQVLYALEDRDMELCRLQVNAILEPVRFLLMLSCTDRIVSSPPPLKKKKT